MSTGGIYEVCGPGLEPLGTEVWVVDVRGLLG